MSDQTRIWACPHCGGELTQTRTGKLGRKPLSISVKNISDALSACRAVSAASQKLGCSRGYIYQELKKHGKTPKEVLQGDDPGRNL
ncbi:MAG: hypothetical protein HYX90_12415 [Chloroflexi bacterium]|nr:hypothetical protein [Chloroflexota bacterium]